MNGNHPNVPVFPGYGRLSAWLSGQVFLVALIISAAVGLTSLSSYVTRSDEGVAANDSLGFSPIDAVEVTDIWLPGMLDQLARCPSGAPIAASPVALRTYLKQQGQENLWYALTIRIHQVNGYVSEMTTIKRLNQAPQDFKEFLDLMAVARGDRPRPPTSDFSRVRINTIPEELLTWEPRQAVSELISLPRSPCHQR